MTIRIRQRYATLGDPCAEMVETREAAEQVAERLRGEIAEMVAGMKPEFDQGPDLGWADECEAWREAEDIAGIERDEDGHPSDTAQTYGREAGAYIAERAVEVDEIE